MGLDSAGQTEESVTTSPRFKQEYRKALAKVQALYRKNEGFQALLKRGAKITHGKLVLGKQTPFALQLIGKKLKKMQAENRLFVTWQSPHGDFGSGGKGFKVFYATRHLLPVTVRIILQDRLDPTLKGTLSVVVPVGIPKGTFHLTLKPTHPKPGAFMRAEVEMPDLYINAYRFHYAWQGKGCRVEGEDRFFVVVKAPKAGNAMVAVRVTAEDKAGKRHFLAYDKAVFGVGKKPPKKVSGNGKEKTAKGDTGDSRGEKGEKGRKKVSREGKSGQKQKPGGVETGVGALPPMFPWRRHRFAGSAPKGWILKDASNYDYGGFSLIRYAKEVREPESSPCTGVSVAASVNGSFPDYGGRPPSQKEILKRLKKFLVKVSKIVPYSLGGYKGYLLERQTDVGNFDGQATLVKGSEQLELNYRVQTTVYLPKRKGCDFAKYTPFIETQSKASLREVHAILSKLRIVKEGSGGAALPPVKTGADTVAVKELRLTTSPAAPWFLGDTVTIRARGIGGKSPYVYRWTGAEAKGKRAVFECRELGKHSVSLEVTDAKGDKFQGKITIIVKAPEFVVTGLPSRPVYGSTARLRVRVKKGRKRKFKPIWQASEPGIAFDPPEGMTTTVTFGRVKDIAVWVQVPQPNGGKTLESKQVHAKVVGPKFKLILTPKDPYVGQEIRAKIRSSVKLSPETIRWVWMNPPPNNRREYDDPASEIGFVINDAKPYPLQAEARVPHYGDVIGKIEAQARAKPYKVKVVVLGPLGSKPMVWKEGKGLVEVDSQIAVHQNVRLTARITPVPKNTALRYEWTLNEDSHFASLSSVKDVMVNRSRTGTCVANVTVKDKYGVILGEGKGNFSVTISQEEIDRGKQKAADRKRSRELARKAKAQWSKNQFKKAMATMTEAVRLDPKNAEARKTLDAWNKKAEEFARAEKYKKDGALMEAAGELEDALEAYKKSLAIRSDTALSAHVKSLEKKIAELKKPSKVADAGTVDTGVKGAKPGRKPLTIDDVAGSDSGGKGKKEKPLSIDDILSDNGASGEKASPKKAASGAGGKPLSIGDVFGEGEKGGGEQGTRTSPPKSGGKKPGKTLEKRRDRLIREGYRAEKEGYLEEAIRKYAEAEKIRHDAKVETHITELKARIRAFDDLIRRGYGYEKKGQLKKAVTIYKKALKIKKDTKVAVHIRVLEKKIAWGAPTDTVRKSSKGAATLKHGVWVLSNVVGLVGKAKKPSPKDYFKYMASGREGRIVITEAIRKNGYVYFKTVSTWPRPPNRLVPGSSISIPLSITKIVDARKYSVNHFLCVDTWDMDCGGTGGGRIGSVKVYSVHSPKNPRMKKTFLWKVPKGKPGKKLTLRFCVSRGAPLRGPRGWKYYYRWVPAGTPLPQGSATGTSSGGKKATRVTRMKTRASSRYKPNCKGDVFRRGHWAGSRGKHDWLQRDFGRVIPISKIYIGRASTDVTTRGFRLVLKLRKPDGTWVAVDTLRDTNINRSKLSNGRIGVSIPSYAKRIKPPIPATAFRLEFYGHGWFDAADIRLYKPKKGHGSKAAQRRQPWTGTYRFDLKDREGTMSVVLKLAQNGTRLTGTIRARAVSSKRKDLNFDFKKKVTGTCNGNRGRIKLEGQPSDKAVLLEDGNKLALYDAEDNKKYVLRRVR